MNFGEKNVRIRVKSLRSRHVRRIHRLQVFLLRFGFLCLLVGVGFGAYYGWKKFREVIADVPDVRTIELAPKGYVTHIRAVDGTDAEVLVGADANRTYVPLRDIPDNLQNAFIAIEDPGFRKHAGIYPIGTIRSFLSFIISGGKMSRGESTITQQLLKNQVFTGGSEGDFLASIRRRIREDYLALRVENAYSKDQILEYYLNTINLGQNTLGVEAASQRYFNKHVTELTLAECAVLAAIAKNPSSYNPIAHATKNKNRELNVLTAMKEQGMISAQEYEKAIDDDVGTRIQKCNVAYQGKQRVLSYFTDALIEDVVEDMKNELDYSETQALNSIYSGGLTIYTTQDTRIQKICDEEIADSSNYPKEVTYQLQYQLTVRHADGKEESFQTSDMKKWFREQGDKLPNYFPTEKKVRLAIRRYRRAVLLKSDNVIAESIRIIPQPQVSFVMMDPATGAVRALVGGRGDKNADPATNRATNTTRQPGETFDVLSTYLPALDTSGMTLATVQDDTEYYYPDTDRLVEDWYGTAYRGLTTMREAISQSINVIEVKTLDQVTPRVGYDYLLNLGFSTLVDGYSDDAGRIYTDITLPMANGVLTKGVTNEEMTAAYATIAGGGQYHKPHLYTKITDHDGKVLIDHEKAAGHRVMKKTTAWLLTDALQGVIRDENEKLLKFENSDMVSAGKGSTPVRSGDLWFMGYTPYLTGGIWCGMDGNGKLKNSSFHKKLWRRIMERANMGYVTKNTFPAPTGIVSAVICTKSGKLAIEDLCENALGGSCQRTEYFTEETLPKDTCDCHVKCRICKASGQLAGDACPKNEIEEIVYLQKKDEVAGIGKTADSTHIMPDSLIDSICRVHNPGNTVKNSKSK